MQHFYIKDLVVNRIFINFIVMNNKVSLLKLIPILWNKIMSVLLLLLTIILTTTTITTTVQASTENTDITTLTQCNTTFDKLASDSFVGDKIFGQLAQNKLHVIYQENIQYKAQYLKINKYLTDGKFGLVTQRWLSYFCHEFSLNTALKEQAFIEELLAALVTISDMTLLYPNWRNDITGKKFQTWAQAHNITCEQTLSCYGSPLVMHGMLDQFYQQQYVPEDEGVDNNLPYYYQLTDNDLTYITKLNDTLDSVVQLTKTQLTELTTAQGNIKNIVFAQAYLLDVALRMQDLNTLSSTAKAIILNRAKKIGVKDLNSMPSPQWQASENCGCAAYTGKATDVSSFHYGFTPHWTLGEQVIDFSQLTRIGYFSASVIEDTFGDSRLVLPFNWGNDNPSPHFINLAHQHRVKVDLVVSNERSHITEQSMNQEFSIRLIDDINKQVRAPLKGDLLEGLKPYLSFGTSPSRTMADGVTLNFDLQHTKEAQHKAFKSFVMRLKYRFNQSYEQSLLPATLTNAVSPAIPSAPEPLLNTATLTDRYYLNMMVPVDQLLAGEGFYTLENLIDISPHVNLFIMMLDNQTVAIINNKPTDATQPAIANDSSATNTLTTMKTLREKMSDQKYTQDIEPLFNKMMLLLAEKNTSNKSSDIEKYSHWSFKGEAYWSLPTDSGQAVINQSTIINELKAFEFTAALDSVASWVCNHLCPQRWLYRAALFTLFTATLVYVILSLWFFQLRGILNTWYFTAYTAGVVVFLMMVFSCDPFWKEYRVFMVMLFALFTVALGFLKRLRTDGAMP